MRESPLVLRAPLKLLDQSFHSNCLVVSGSHNSSYVLALTLGEQLSSATHSMFEMAPLAADWNATARRTCCSEVPDIWN